MGTATTQALNLSHDQLPLEVRSVLGHGLKDFGNPLLNSLVAGIANGSDWGISPSLPLSSESQV
jgi:hypothetical protein